MGRDVLVLEPELPRARDDPDHAKCDRGFHAKLRKTDMAAEGAESEHPHHDQCRRRRDYQKALRTLASNTGEEQVDAHDDRYQEPDEHDRLARRTSTVNPGAPP